MTDDDRLREEIRALADRFEADAEPEERVAARLSRRASASRLPSLALVAVIGVVIIVAAVGVRSMLPDTTGGGEPVLPVGLFRSAVPDRDGECVALRLYETTLRDRRVAIWHWAGTPADGCDARRSNLAMGEGVIAEVTLPARPNMGLRFGLRIDDPEGRPRADPAFILDPSAAAGDSLAGYSNLDEIDGEPTLLLEPIEELTVPYRPD